MALEMKNACESCDRGIEHDGDAYICSYECTFCPVCRAGLKVCPNCGGELMLRPRRRSQELSHASIAGLSCANQFDVQRGGCTPYTPRATRMACIHKCCGWTLKVYEVCFGSHSMPADQLAKTLDFVEKNVPWPSVSISGQNAGFVIVHRGRDAMWLIVHVWQSDILVQFAFQATLLEPVDFVRLRSDGMCGCVWELEVIKHERDAWVRCSMGSDDRAAETYWNDNLFLIRS